LPATTSDPRCSRNYKACTHKLKLSQSPRLSDPRKSRLRNIENIIAEHDSDKPQNKQHLDCSEAPGSSLRNSLASRHLETPDSLFSTERTLNRNLVLVPPTMTALLAVMCLCYRGDGVLRHTSNDLLKLRPAQYSASAMLVPKYKAAIFSSVQSSSKLPSGDVNLVDRLRLYPNKLSSLTGAHTLVFAPLPRHTAHGTQRHRHHNTRVATSAQGQLSNQSMTLNWASTSELPNPLHHTSSVMHLTFDLLFRPGTSAQSGIRNTSTESTDIDTLVHSCILDHSSIQQDKNSIVDSDLFACAPTEGQLHESSNSPSTTASAQQCDIPQATRPQSTNEHPKEIGHELPNSASTPAARPLRYPDQTSPTAVPKPRHGIEPLTSFLSARGLIAKMGVEVMNFLTGQQVTPATASREASAPSHSQDSLPAQQDDQANPASSAHYCLATDFTDNKLPSITTSARQRSIESPTCPAVTTPNYPVRSGPHYITNDIGSDLYRTRVTYRGVPGARRSC
jgi:hypothetical protein